MGFDYLKKTKLHYLSLRSKFKIPLYYIEIAGCYMYSCTNRHVLILTILILLVWLLLVFVAIIFENVFLENVYGDLLPIKRIKL